MENHLGTVFGRNLRAFRSVEGQSTAEFAARIGVASDYLEGLEEGRVDPDLKTLEEVAEKIGMEPLLLLEENQT